MGPHYFHSLPPHFLLGYLGLYCNPLNHTEGGWGFRCGGGSGGMEMGLVILCIGIVGFDLEGEAAPITLAAVNGGVFGLERL